MSELPFYLPQPDLRIRLAEEQYVANNSGRISVVFPDHLRAELSRAASEHDRTFSAELRQAVREYVAEKAPGVAPSREPRSYPHSAVPDGEQS